MAKQLVKINYLKRWTHDQLVVGSNLVRAFNYISLSQGGGLVRTWQSFG